MKYNDHLGRLYEEYMISNVNNKYKFFHSIKMKYYEKKLKWIIKKKLSEDSLTFTEYTWVLNKLLTQDQNRSIWTVNTGLHQYDCRIQDCGNFYQLHIDKYDYNFYKQKLDAAGINVNITFSYDEKGAGSINVKLDTGFAVYEKTMSEIPLMEDGLGYFINHFTQSKFTYMLSGAENIPINTYYYIYLPVVMKGLIYKVFELEE